MGTNYYMHKNVCDCCRRAQEIIHIGKSSAGWKFMFRAYPPIVTNYADWRAAINNVTAKIIDEYGTEVSAEAFFELVERKQGERAISHMDYVDGYCFSEGEFS